MQENYQIIKNKNPYLCSLLNSTSINNINYEQSKHGDTILVAEYNQKKIYLNSKYNPKKEARTRIEQVNVNSPTIFQVGIGYGYEFEELYRNKKKNAFIIIIEPNPSILAAALNSNYNLQDLFNDNRVLIISGSKIQINEQLHEVKKHFPFSKEIELFVNHYAFTLYEQSNLKELIELIKTTIIARYTSAGNDIKDTLIGIRHMFTNSPHFPYSKNIEELQKYYKGMPIVCVASGPSLDKNINELYNIQEHVLIFCADTSYEKLLNYSIIPDAVSTTERMKKVYDLFYKNKTFHPNTVLFAEGLVYPEILSEFPNAKAITFRSTKYVENRFGEFFKSTNIEDVGSSCAHMSFAMAKRLKSDPIILLGQDLAYSEEGYSHANSTYMEGKTIEEAKQNVEYTIAYDGVSKVKTHATWNLFRNWFEEQISQTPNRIINATEGGAFIHGAEHISLKETVERYISSNKKRSFIEDMGKLEPGSTNEDMKNFADFIDFQLSNFEEIEKLLKKIDRKIEIIHDIVSIKKNVLKQDLAKRILKQCIQYMDQVWEYDHFRSIVVPIILQLNQHGHDINVISTRKEIIKYYEFLWGKVRQLLQLMPILREEYKRGKAVILNQLNNNVDNNDFFIEETMEEIYE
ncbi:motility associated factor glycosyltransferase family protein [Salibacterium qingdaonense]|uniref:Uncharacterized conserved protein n=1 Tax=Salibacterium qingdaonense TaxID=266892 RepID=A0A1I4KZV2_9BACI|nr:6-hydroxymethylpterin diphosphokinase MptE-like protein [Salibacterium qingdaonense]SFL84270.1 Uncharacterized conserved protein [Salibacterium qingdaonense]